MALVNLDTGSIVIAELSPLVGATVAVIVAERDDTSVFPLPQRDVDDTVVRDRDVAAAAEVFREHGGAETLRQREIVAGGIAARRGSDVRSDSARDGFGLGVGRFTGTREAEE